MLKDAKEFDRCYRGTLYRHHTNTVVMRQNFARLASRYLRNNLQRAHHFHERQVTQLLCSHHHHAHYNTSSSEDSDLHTKYARGSLPAKGEKRKVALTSQLYALCKAHSSDQEALHALEALAHQIRASDDPEGLLVGAAYLKLATVYSSMHCPNIMKGLAYAQKAVKAYEPRGPSLKLATSLYISALIHITMGDSRKAVIQLEQSDSVMKRMKVTPCDKYCVALKHDVQTVMGESCDAFCNLVNFDVQALFGMAKMHLGMHDEAAAHIHKSLKLKRKLLPAGSLDLGLYYVSTAEVLKLLKDHKAATQLCLKALKIFLKCHGADSLEEAKARSLLSDIYYDVGKYEESLAESKLARRIWKHFGKTEKLICLNLNAERLLVCLKRWDEAMSRLEEVIQATEIGNKSHTIALILSAKVCELTNKNNLATHYCRRALEAVEHQVPCMETAATLMSLCFIYEDRKEFGQAALFCKKAQEMYEQCFGSETVEIAADVEGKLGCLLVHAGKHEEAIPHLESSISKLKHIPGKDLLYKHFYLGLAYPKIEKYQEALEQFEAAKSALCRSTEVSIQMQVAIYSNLAATYSAVNRLDEAIECQKVVVDMLKQHTVEDYTLEEVQLRLTSYIKEAEALKESVWHNR